MVDSLTAGVRSAFRDFEIDGVPASGDYEPSKTEIRSALSNVTREVVQVRSALVTGVLGYAAIEDLPTLTVGDAGAMAKVEGEGVYRWSGTAWEAFADPVLDVIGDAVGAAVGPAVAAAVADGFPTALGDRLKIDGTNAPGDAEPLREAIDTPSRAGDGVSSLAFKANLRVYQLSVHDAPYNAVGDGTTDDSAAFNSAA